MSWRVPGRGREWLPVRYGAVAVKWLHQDFRLERVLRGFCLIHLNAKTGPGGQGALRELCELILERQRRAP